MNKEQVLQIIDKRRQEDTKFRTRYDAFMAEKKAERLLTDSELNDVSGGFYFCASCPKCGQYDGLETYTFGIYNCCKKCGYEEWGRGWI